MQENYRNGQDDSDIADQRIFHSHASCIEQTHFASPVDYNWLKQGPESTGRTSLSQF